ncbi:hypothetical protein JYU34_013886 [Plutella xylostella]|uniref:Envelope fusion protein n=1 Tax=Plutella xylostella TaxID=51655 RepID=A0ABQ7QAW9_PLUXY|nr:hypothetical protein JYU34_013886 [Plutella xylostella]
MLLQILLLWYSTTFVVGENLTKSLPSNSGLYFQEEDEITIAEGSWKLVIYRNLEPLFLTKESLLRLTNKYYSLTNKYPELAQTHLTTSFININLEKINSRLAELTSYSETFTRKKREIFDGLGTVLKWLIGTPDAKDAQHFDKCINLLEKHEIETSEILQQQLQIVSTTVTNFNETIFKISYDEHIINENLDRLSNYLNKTNKILFDLKIIEEINSISMQILESVISLEQEIDDILMSILFVKLEIVHPSIISTTRLYRELLSSSHMRSDKSLVLPITMSNIHKILDSSSLTSYIYMNRLTYVIEFPLIKNDKFIIYHLYSIPIKHPNTSLYSTILPEQTYLATSSTQQQYVTINSLDQCKLYAPGKRVCNRVPVYNYNTRPICEMAILLSYTHNLPNICEVTTFSASINTFQRISANKWIYILNRKTPCVLQCGDQTSHHELNDAGILSLQEGCKLFSTFITLTTTKEESMNITHPVVTVDISANCLTDVENIPPTPELLPIRINNVPLENLQSMKDELKQYSNKLKNLNEKSFIERHTSKFSIISLE